MPAIVAILLLLMGYQLFFRYDNWPSDKYEGVIYERDTLTGTIRTIRPGEQIDFTHRLLGDGLAQKLAEANRPPDFNEAFNFSMIDVSNPGVSNGQQPQNSPFQNTVVLQATPIQNQTQNTSAQNIQTPRPNTASAPIPGNNGIGQFSVQKVDLNNDGELEEVIQRITANDGMVDISIVRHGREIFYGRGKQLQILNTRHDGWLDIALNTGEAQSPVYKFNKNMDGYSANTTQTASR